MSSSRRPTTFRPEDIEIAEPLLLEDPIAGGAGDGESADPHGETIPRDDPARREGFSWAAFVWAGLGGLVSLAIGMAVDRLITNLFARSDVLGWLALGLAGLAALGVLGIVLREAFALRRVRAVEHLRAQAEDAVVADDPAAAREVLKALSGLYADRAETARGRTALAGHMSEVIDGRDMIVLGEREVLAALDARAKSLILASAKRVTLVTAVSPRALIAIAYVIIEGTRLVRRLATLYAGRPGTLGFLRLARHAVQHLAVTGGMAAGDSLLHEVVGHSIASRLSTRMGEGVVNGLMTARLGLAALDVCRPLPFVGARRPRIGDILSELSRLDTGGKQ